MNTNTVTISHGEHSATIGEDGWVQLSRAGLSFGSGQLPDESMCSLREVTSDLSALVTGMPTTVPKPKTFVQQMIAQGFRMDTPTVTITAGRYCAIIRPGVDVEIEYDEEFIASAELTKTDLVLNRVASFESTPQLLALKEAEAEEAIRALNQALKLAFGAWSECSVASVAE